MIWLNLAVKPHFSWPNVPIELPFEGTRLVLQPLTDTLCCTVSLFEPGGTTFEDGGTVLGRFLSRLAWSRNGGVVELFYIGTNNPERPGRLGRGTYGTSGWSAVEPSKYLYLPAAATPESDLGLALYREGMSVNSSPFAFLSFFKILNILHSKGEAQWKWVNDNLKHIWYQPAVDRLQEIRKTESDVGKYMYVQGRCAVAHAYGTPIVNPNVYADKRRLELDLPLMKELAALFIEQELGVVSNDSFLKSPGATAGSNELLKKDLAQKTRVLYAPYPSNA